MDEKLKSENMQKRAFSVAYFGMHHFVVKFSKFSSPQAARGHRYLAPLTKILRMILV